MLHVCLIQTMPFQGLTHDTEESHLLCVCLIQTMPFQGLTHDTEESHEKY
jgi:hypothetical protein